MHKRLISALVGIGLGMSSVVYAAEGFDEYVAGLKQQALLQGISEPVINEAFEGVKYIRRAVKADRSQPEKRITLDQYIPSAVPDWKVKQAQQLYLDNKEVLYRIGRKYGVQPRFIVALWGVESNFGKFTGNYNVIEALATLAYDGRREAFFRKELMSALTILQQGHIKPSNMKGSWAGAMGQCQFMPSSFLAYAVDGNNDGKIDIWSTKADVFASAANYLKQVGWDKKYTWGRQVTLPASFDHKLAGLAKSKAKKLSQWQALGVRRLNGKALPRVDINAWLVQPDDIHGRSYLVYGNYQAIMRWNRSHYFALAVSHLADRIKGKKL